MKRPSQNQRILDLLSDGRWHSHHELYAIGCVAHSRVSELRSQGHTIEHRRIGSPGPDAIYEYRLSTCMKTENGKVGEGADKTLRSIDGSDPGGAEQCLGVSKVDAPSPTSSRSEHPQPAAQPDEAKTARLASVAGTGDALTAQRAVEKRSSRRAHNPEIAGSTPAGAIQLSFLDAAA